MVLVNPKQPHINIYPRHYKDKYSVTIVNSIEDKETTKECDVDYVNRGISFINIHEFQLEEQVKYLCRVEDIDSSSLIWYGTVMLNSNIDQYTEPSQDGIINI